MESRLSVLALLMLSLPAAAILPAQEAPQTEPGSSPGQQEPFRGTNRGRFSVLRDAGLSFRLAAADRLLAEGKHVAAIEALVEILRAPPSIVQELGDGSFVGLRESARDRLRRLDPAGKEAFERLVRGELEGPVQDALIERRPKQLAALAARYPSTRSGDLARLAAGDGFLEAGDYLAALEAFSLYDGADPDGRVRFRKLLCRRLLDLPVAPIELDGLHGPDGRGLEDWLESTLAGRDYGASPAYWPAYGGGLEGNRLAEVPLDPHRRVWGTELRGIGRIHFNIHAVADGRRVYVDTGSTIQGLDILTGQGWRFDSPILDHPEVRDFEFATSNKHILSCALGGDVLVAPLQVPVILDEGADNQSFRGIPIMSRLPVRRLFAFEPETGRRLWSHWEDGLPLSPELARVPLDTCGPPTVIGDRIFVPTAQLVGGISYYVSAFDLHTGQPLWKTFVLSSQIEVNMFGNAQWEFSAPPLAYANGCLYGTTNLGANFSIRCDDGAIRWLRPYQTISQEPTRMIVEEREVYWANNPPVISDGVLIVTPLDSRCALAMAAETGEPLWRANPYIRSQHRPADNVDLYWLLGVEDGKVWFQGHAITTIPLYARRGGGLTSHEVVVPPSRLGMSRMPDRRDIPRGLLATGRLVLPLQGDAVGIFDLEGREVSMPRGQDGGRSIGNLLVSGGVLLSLSSESEEQIHLDAFFSHETLRAEARRRVQEDPRDPRARIGLAELLAADPRGEPALLTESVTGFRAALELCAAEGLGGSLTRRARKGWFEAERRLGQMSLPLDRERALRHFETAWSIGRELGGLARERLRELLIELLDRYPDKRELRSRVLAALERDFGDERRYFPGLGRVEISLFVLIERLRDLPEDRAHSADRLALLRTILIRHGDGKIDGEPARSWAMTRCQALLERHGREIYAPFEKEARKLFDEASGSPARLKVVLDRYPNSETALYALVHLVRSAAGRGELRTALEAWSLARTRLGSIPAELFGSLALAARGAGNLALAGSFEARAEGRIPGQTPIALPNTLALHPRRAVQATDNESLNGALKPLTPTRVRGFTSPPSLPLLVWSSVGELWAYARSESADGPSYDFARPLFRRVFTAEPFPLELSVHGSVLVLPETDQLRGIDLNAHGRLLWSYRVPEAPAGDQRPPRILAGGPLATGLYGFCLSRGEGDDQVVEFIGIEPLTGIQMFQVRLAGLKPFHDYEFREGSFYYLVENNEGMGERLVLRDGLDGGIAARFDFDGTRLPELSIASTNAVLLTGKELFFLTRDDKTRPAGIFAYDLSGKRLWSHREPGLTDRDRFLVFESQVLLARDLERSNAIGHAVLLDRSSGERLRDVVIGKHAWLPGRSTLPALLPDGPLLFLADGTGAKTRALLLDPRPGVSSWLTDLGWAREDLRHGIAGGTPMYGADFVLLGRGREFGRSTQLELQLLSLEDGKLLPDPDYRAGAFPAEVELANWNGQLLLQRRDGQTWVYVDTMGR